MTEEEYIEQAQVDWEENSITTIGDALEASYQNGSYDGVGGDIDAPVGQYVHSERWILVTKNVKGVNGEIVEILTFDTFEEAEARFQELEQEYDKWTDT